MYSCAHATTLPARPTGLLSHTAHPMHVLLACVILVPPPLSPSCKLTSDPSSVWQMPSPVNPVRGTVWNGLLHARVGLKGRQVRNSPGVVLLLAWEGEEGKEGGRGGGFGNDPRFFYNPLPSESLCVTRNGKRCDSPCGGTLHIYSTLLCCWLVQRQTCAPSR